MLYEFKLMMEEFRKDRINVGKKYYIRGLSFMWWLVRTLQCVGIIAIFYVFYILLYMVVPQ